MRYLLLVLSALCLTSCTTLISPFDGVYEIHLDSDTPEGFEVSVAETFKVVPFTKEKWHIYADHQYYYFHPYGSNYLLWSNSTLAKRWNLKLSGKDRATYQELTKLFHNGRIHNVKSFTEILRRNSPS